MIRNTLETLVVEASFNEGSRLKHCYFYGSKVEEVADETNFIECTSLYYAGKGIYVAVKYEDNTIISAAYIFQYNNCWISMILPLIYRNCDKNKDIDRIYDLVADQYAEIAEYVVDEHTRSLMIKYKKLEVYQYGHISARNNYSCEMHNCQPFYHCATGEFGTCMEYVVRDDNILDEWFD